MGRLRRAPEVIKIAENLGLRGDDPVGAIMKHCRALVESWFRQFKGPATLSTLHRIISDRLSVHHVVIASHQELDNLIREQTERGEAALVTLKEEFVNGTEAITFKLTNPIPGMKRHLAVIDGRGNRGVRVYFSKLHENSHLITFSPHQLSLVFRRTHTNKAPAEEALMDKIAGELAFYPPLFQPELRLLQRRYGRPCFELADQVRSQVCPEASKIATTIAAIEQNEESALLVTARYSSKVGDQRQPQTSWALRATSVRGSPAARKVGLVIPWNYRIPQSSRIHQVFHDPFSSIHIHADERLGTWTSSDGSRLPDLPIHVEVKKQDDYVLAIITLN